MFGAIFHRYPSFWESIEQPNNPASVVNDLNFLNVMSGENPFERFLPFSRPEEKIRTSASEIPLN